jgi:hypothetical protein
MSREFSKRYGYGLEEAEITVREDAPAGLRYGWRKSRGRRG